MIIKRELPNSPGKASASDQHIESCPDQLKTKKQELHAAKETLKAFPDMIEGARKVEVLEREVEALESEFTDRLLATPAAEVTFVSTPQKAGSADSSVLSPQQRSSRALRKYQASFLNDKLTPPTRSYRNLCCMHDFQPYIDGFERAMVGSELKTQRDLMKPFKLAINKLVGKARNAYEQLQKPLKYIKSKNKDVGSAVAAVSPSAPASS